MRSKTHHKIRLVFNQPPLKNLYFGNLNWVVPGYINSKLKVIENWPSRKSENGGSTTFSICQPRVAE
jgi:hypothetical protein